MKKITLLALALASCGLNAAVTQTSTPGLAIPDNDPTCATNSITFTETGTISDINVAIEITHTFRGDLELDLTYNATNVILAQGHGGSADNYFATFDSESVGGDCATLCGTATECISAGTAQVCTPDASLTAYNTMNATTGTWDLRVCDVAGGDFGTLDSWSVTADGDGQLPVELMNLSID